MLKVEATRQQRQRRRRAARAMPAALEEKAPQSQKSGLTNQTAAAGVATSREPEAASAQERTAEG